MGAAERTTERRPPVSIEGLVLAARRLRIKLVLAAMIPMALNGMLHFVERPWSWGWPLALLVLTLFLGYRRSVYALLPAYFLLAAIWAELWLFAPDAGMPVRVDYVIEIDRVLGLGRLPTVWLQELHGFPYDRVWEVPLVAVYVSFFLAHQALVFVLFFGRRELAARYAIAFMVTAYLAVIVMTLLPTVPPWMAAQQGAAPDILRIAHEILRGVDDSAFEAGYESARLNEVAAMPSLHMGATVVIAIVASRASARLRPFAIAYAAAMAFALVYLGEHYLIDVIVGSAFAFVGWRVADAVFDLPVWHRSADEPEAAQPDPLAEPEARAA